MKKIMIAFSLMTFMTCSASANDQPSEKKNNDAAIGKTTCKNKTDIRTLELIKNKNGCELKYETAGSKRVVASSANDLKHCMHFKIKIETKLEKAGFVCG